MTDSFAVLSHAPVMGFYWGGDRNAPKRGHRPFCAATTRAGHPCRMRVEQGKARCRLHGGFSTGPRTQEGKARIAEAQRQRWQRWRENQELMQWAGVMRALRVVAPE